MKTPKDMRGWRGGVLTSRDSFKGGWKMPALRVSWCKDHVKKTFPGLANTAPGNSSSGLGPRSPHAVEKSGKSFLGKICPQLLLRWLCRWRLISFLSQWFIINAEGAWSHLSALLSVWFTALWGEMERLSQASSPYRWVDEGCEICRVKPERAFPLLFPLPLLWPPTSYSAPYISGTVESGIKGRLVLAASWTFPAATREVSTNEGQDLPGPSRPSPYPMEQFCLELVHTAVLLRLWGSLSCSTAPSVPVFLAFGDAQ